VKLRRPTPKVLRRTLMVTAVLLALGGIGLIAYPFATDLWAEQIQRTLASEMTPGSYSPGDIRTGEALTRLEMPSIDVDTIVVEGTTPEALRAGAGHYPQTPLPGERGNVAIAGHRTTFSKPFNRMDELGPGDKVILTTPIGEHVYEVIGEPAVVEPTDWAPIDDYPKKGSWLTLTSCYPEGSDEFRIVVRAKLVDSTGKVAGGAAVGRQSLGRAAV
jgi:sortase A